METYANITKSTREIKKETKQSYKIIIKAKNKINSDKVKEEIKQTINPITNKLGIKNVRKLRTGAVEIETITR